MTKKMMKATTLLLFMGMFSTLSFAVPDSFKDIVKKVNPAVVYVEVTMEMQGAYNVWGQSSPQDVVGSGSGVIIDAEKGYILTAAHVINGISKATVNLLDGRKFEAVEMLYDTQTDVGLIKIDVPAGEKLPSIEFGSSENLEVGDWVLAMGSPLGKALVNSVSAGIVSGKGRKSGILGQFGIEDFIQTDAVINKGNSGGPLVNMDGQIVGINSNIISATGLSTGLGFAVPGDLAKEVVGKLINDGAVVRGYLGVSVTSLDTLDTLKDKIDTEIPDDIMKSGGAYVVEVVANGPGDEAGIKEGDIITMIDDQNIKESSELIKLISSKTPDTTVVCKVYRNGKTKDIKVKLGVRPGTGGSGEKAIVTSRDKDAVGYKIIGIVVDDYSEQQSDIPGGPVLEGVKIRNVAKNSIAAEFGLKDGDIIVEVDGERVKNTTEFNDAVDNADINDGILLSVKDKDGNFKKVLIKKF